MTRPLWLLFGPALLAGCMTTSERAQGGAEATLASSDGGTRGVIKIAEAAGGLRVDVDAEALPAGTHGIHVHTTGRCDSPDFTSAGPHWNPTERKHGRENPEGAHHGDLPNIVIGSDGRGKLSFTLPSASFAQLFDADGASIIIHATADDYRTDPSGNSGGRIACGVISQR